MYLYKFLTIFIVIPLTIGIPISLPYFNNSTVHILSTDHPPPFKGYTTDTPIVAGKYYYGGAVTPYWAGSKTYLGLYSMNYDRNEVIAVLPGYWGTVDQVQQYNYTTNFNTSLLFVQCFCINNYPCSCDINSSPSYFKDLPNDRYMKFQEGESSFAYYVNGTLNGDYHKVSWASTHKSAVALICVFTIVPGLYFIILSL